MNSTKQFQQVLKAYLDRMAEQDEAFSIVYADENKSIEECATYVVQCIAKSAREQKTDALGMASDEVFGLAVHYYQEDDVEVDEESFGFKFVTDEQAAGLSEEDKSAIRNEAIAQYLKEQKDAKKALNLQKSIANSNDKKQVQLQLDLFA